MIVLDEIKMYLLYDRHTLNAWIRHFCTNDLFTKNIVEFEAEYGLLGGFYFLSESSNKIEFPALRLDVCAKKAFEQEVMFGECFMMSYDSDWICFNPDDVEVTLDTISVNVAGKLSPLEKPFRILTRTAPYDLRGTSFLMPVLKTLMYRLDREKAKAEAGQVDTDEDAFLRLEVVKALFPSFEAVERRYLRRRSEFGQELLRRAVPSDVTEVAWGSHIDLESALNQNAFVTDLSLATGLDASILLEGLRTGWQK